MFDKVFDFFTSEEFIFGTLDLGLAVFTIGIKVIIAVVILYYVSMFLIAISPLAKILTLNPWFLLPYVLLFFQQVREYLALPLWQLILLATVLSYLIYKFAWIPIQRKNPKLMKKIAEEQDNRVSGVQGARAKQAQGDTYEHSNAFSHINQDSKTKKRDLNALDSIVGMEKAKSELRDAIEMPLIYPDKIKKYDLKPASGLILYGPPGTGKTALARAAASYFGAEFFLVNATSLVGEFVGTTEAAVKDVFKKARSKTPSIIFFDEIDAIGAKRDGRNMNRPSDIILNLLLTELDGFEKREGVFVLAATNRLDVLDDALLRPGRFDVKIEITAPNGKERLDLLEFFARKKPLGMDVDLREIAKRTEGLTGAYLEGLTNSAAKRAVRRSIDTGRDEKIMHEDYLIATNDMAMHP
ncbi:ATP-binding protein [Desulfitobacterium chlororespirans]|uniref:ATPase family associated with various cellular activities (AAA) n=1 Tax=Desulfitobacterium chlororespirans DSM 11544 TaxID=1121395 RepID=A0A1M7T6E3_9FIRM|nr:AAA family ATPase [Desulfitobacterium chlororespirans]SHN66294.1 ATPase family associated with various cellular activities (AAA) [Desulfitobacterium chlororespirans DSM 11544]